jgi:hypothetical protein
LGYLAAAALALGSTVSGAEPAAQTANAKPGGTVSKPQEKLICEKIIVTGSRLAAHTYCATAEQWAQQRLQDRQMIEQVQMSPCVLTHNGPGGKPSC